MWLDKTRSVWKRLEETLGDKVRKNKACVTEDRGDTGLMTLEETVGIGDAVRGNNECERTRI
jgi:hypothetical protein